MKRKRKRDGGESAEAEDLVVAEAVRGAVRRACGFFARKRSNRGSHRRGVSFHQEDGKAEALRVAMKRFCSDEVAATYAIVLSVLDGRLGPSWKSVEVPPFFSCIYSGLRCSVFQGVRFAYREEREDSLDAFVYSVGDFALPHETCFHYAAFQQLFVEHATPKILPELLDRGFTHLYGFICDVNGGWLDRSLWKEPLFYSWLAGMGKDAVKSLAWAGTKLHAMRSGPVSGRAVDVNKVRLLKERLGKLGDPVGGVKSVMVERAHARSVESVLDEMRRENCWSEFGRLKRFLRTRLAGCTAEAVALVARYRRYAVHARSLRAVLYQLMRDSDRPLYNVAILRSRSNTFLVGSAEEVRILQAFAVSRLAAKDPSGCVDAFSCCLELAAVAAEMEEEDRTPLVCYARRALGDLLGPGREPFSAFVAAVRAFLEEGDGGGPAALGPLLALLCDASFHRVGREAHPLLFRLASWACQNALGLPLDPPVLGGWPLGDDDLERSRPMFFSLAAGGGLGRNHWSARWSARSPGLVPVGAMADLLVAAEADLSLSLSAFLRSVAPERNVEAKARVLLLPEKDGVAEDVGHSWPSFGGEPSPAVRLVRASTGRAPQKKDGWLLYRIRKTNGFDKIYSSSVWAFDQAAIGGPQIRSPDAVVADRPDPLAEACERYRCGPCYMAPASQADQRITDLWQKLVWISELPLPNV